MKRTIFLKLGYETGPAIRAKMFKQFRQDIKPLAYIKIIKEFEPRAELIIEFEDARYQDMYDTLRKLDSVEMIDPILAKDA